MKRLFSARSMRNADEAAIASGVPARVLMENAGSGIAATCLIKSFPKIDSCLILAGKGNNGGDAYVVARILLDKGFDVLVLEQNPIPSSEESQATRAAFLVKRKPKQLNKANLKSAIKNSDLIIDGLFGSGLSRPLEGEIAEIVTIINESNKPILSIDIPSGVIADRAEIIGPHIKADVTVQLAGAKISSAFYPSKYAFGKSKVVDIGISDKLLKDQSNIRLLDKKAVKSFLPKRAKDSHKYNVGTVLVVAGSSKYAGAAELASRAALRAGAGLVTLASQNRMANSWPEIIFRKIGDDAVEDLSNIEEKYASARVIGPGLSDDFKKNLEQIIMMSEVPTVLDASALLANKAWENAVINHAKTVLTPHFGEAAILLDLSPKEIAKDPIKYAGVLAEKYNAIVVLKSATNVIVDRNDIFVSSRGHPGMATGGSGDVLAGIIAAFLAQAGYSVKAVAAAVYIHGKAGEKAAGKYGYGLIASDLIDNFAKVWQNLSK